MNRKSIRFQLMAWYGSLFFVAFLIFGASSYFVLQHFLYQNISNSLQNRAVQISENVMSNYPGKTPDWIKREIDARYTPQNSGRFIRIIESGTNIIYLSEAPRDESFDPASIAMPINSHTGTRVVTSNKGALLVRTIQRIEKGSRLSIEVGGALEPVQETMKGISMSLVVTGPLVIGLAIFGAYLLVGRVLTPVDRITASAERITLENLSSRLPVAQTGDELERLSNSLNRMIERIHAGFLTDKRFVADASHELRTPVAIIYAELEALAGSRSVDETTRERIGSTLEEVERLGRIVDALFAITRLDSGEAQSEWKPVNVSELVSLTADQMFFLAEDKQVRVEKDIVQGVLIQGDHQRIKQILVNLLDNAINYTPAGGLIRISVSSDASEAHVRIADTGIGIPEEALELVFDRFYRGEGAKIMNESGAGLGLSIVKSICVAHKGRIWITPNTGPGCCVHVVFPRQ